MSSALGTALVGQPRHDAEEVASLLPELEQRGARGRIAEGQLSLTRCPLLGPTTFIGASGSRPPSELPATLTFDVTGLPAESDDRSDGIALCRPGSSAWHDRGVARQRLIRDEPPVPGEAVLVRALFDTSPRGSVFDPEVLIADVTYNFELFGYYGLSLWLVSDSWPFDRVLSEKTRKARRVALFTADALLEQGLGLVPSGKAPHYDTSHGPAYGASYGSVRVTAGSAAGLVDRFIGAAYTVEDNSFYAQDPS